MFSYEEIQKYNETDIRIYKYIVSDIDKIQYMTIRELAKKRAYASEATKKSRQKMYEEAATGNPEAVERYENYLAARREAYHRKKQEAEKTA